MTRTIAAPVPRKLRVSFSDEQVQGMKNLLKACPLPEQPPVQASQAWELGMDLDFLKALRNKFINEWSWSTLENKLNEFDNYIVELEELNLHFIHAKSNRPDAVPLLLLHGWPGTAYDFHRVIDTLVNPPEGQKAFHVVVPSLPGFFLSTLPRRENWSLDDTARVTNHLMVDILGYPEYASQGGDWGSYILRITGCLFPENAPLILFNMFRSPAVSIFDYEAASPPVKKNMDQRKRFASKGRGYVDIQSTKPFTIGYAVGTSPLAILAYIGEKFHQWSDPSCLDPSDIIDTTALYFLSGSFPTSVMVYQQSSKIRAELIEDPTKWRMKSKIGYAVFPYEIGGSPLADVRQVGDVAFYTEHARGGHFPALDVPDDFVDDLRRCFANF